MSLGEHVSLQRAWAEDFFLIVVCFIYLFIYLLLLLLFVAGEMFFVFYSGVLLSY